MSYHSALHIRVKEKMEKLSLVFPSLEMKRIKEMVKVLVRVKGRV